MLQLLTKSPVFWVIVIIAFTVIAGEAGVIEDISNGFTESATNITKEHIRLPSPGELTGR